MYTQRSMTVQSVDDIDDTEDPVEFEGFVLSLHSFFEHLPLAPGASFTIPVTVSAKKTKQKGVCLSAFSLLY